MNVITLRVILAAAGTALALASAPPVYAKTKNGNASASALEADLPLGVGIGPVTKSSAKGKEKKSDQRFEVTAPPYLRAGILNSSASSDVDDTPGAKKASSSASVVDLDVVIPSFFSLSADALSSESAVNGDTESFSANGNSSIANLSGSGLLAGLQVAAVNGTPNQVLLDSAGVSVIANRQSTSCSSLSCTQTTDALFVNVSNVATITLASTVAQLSGDTATTTAPIPEPSTWAMMVAGLFGLGAMRRARSRSA